MGCSSCKPEKILPAEEQQICKFESSLNIHSLNMLQIDRVLHRYSMLGGMSVSQFDQAFRELGIKHSENTNFWNFFYESYQYNMKRLNCLGILLTSEPASRKLKILFQNYDTNTSGFLDKEQLECMIDDITIVACEFIPEGTINYLSNCIEIKKYANHVKSIRKSLIKQMVSSIMENKESVGEREFCLSYQQDDGVRYLLDTKGLRMYCHFVRTNLIGSVDNILNKINEENKEQIFNLIGKGQKKRRKSRRGTICKELEGISYD